MNSITFNEFTVKYEEDSFLVIGSLDVDSLLTNISFDKTINICTNTV